MARPANAQDTIARNAASKRGLVRYLGVACRLGHDGERYVTSGGCIACAEMAGQRRRQKLAARLLEIPRSGREPVVWWKPGYQAIDER